MKTIIEQIQERQDYSEACGLAGIGYHGADAHDDRDTLLDLLREVGELEVISQNMMYKILESVPELSGAEYVIYSTRNPEKFPSLKAIINRGDV
jgi:hypothetical protein